MTKDTNTSVAEQNSDTKPADNENVVNQPAVNQGNDTPENAIPYARFNELNKQYKSLQDEMSSMKANQDKQRTARMEEEGKFKELNAELQTKNEKLIEQNNYYLEQEQKERDTLLGKLPEDDRGIYEDLSTEKLRKHLESVSSRTSVPTDKSNAVRGNVLSDDKDIFAMSTEDKRKNWTAYLNKFKK